MERPRAHIQDPENFRVITSGQVLIDDIARQSQVLKPGQRLWVSTMFFGAGKLMDQVYDVMSTAGQTGADVRLKADTLASDNKTRRLVEALETHPDIQFTRGSFGNNSERHVMFYRSDHRKGIFIGDTSYMTDKNFTDRNFYGEQGSALKITDPAITTVFAEKTMDPNPDRDSRTQVTPETAVLIDSGATSKSIIYETALAMIKAAGERKGFIGLDIAHAVYGEIWQELIKAHRNGAVVEIVAPTGTTLGHDWAFYLIHRLAQKNAKRTTNRPAVVSYKPKRLHSKNLFTDQDALVTSNNLLEIGVSLRTRENGIYTTNPRGIENLDGYHTFLMENSH